MARFGFGQPIGQCAGEKLAFRVFQRVAGVTELAGCIEEFGIAHSLGSPALQVVEGAPGQ
jgi:hypothetical protein